MVLVVMVLPFCRPLMRYEPIVGIRAIPSRFIVRCDEQEPAPAATAQPEGSKLWSVVMPQPLLLEVQVCLLLRNSPARQDEPPAAVPRSRSSPTHLAMSLMRTAKPARNGHSAAAEDIDRTHGDNAPQPTRTLRDWLDHMAARDRLAVVKPGIALRFELAAVAKRLDGQRDPVSAPGGHACRSCRASRRTGAGWPKRWASSRANCSPASRTRPSIQFLVGRSARRRPRRWSIARSIWPSSCRFRPTTSTTAGPTSRPP